MAASAPSITVIKMLFARSGNRCAFPKCTAPIAVGNTMTGEVCHIKGARLGSPRYDSAQTDVERHAYANLILMCPNHHTVIDADEEAFTVKHLLKIKVAHEAQSIPVPDDAAAAVVEEFTKSVKNIGQSGGLSAYNVNASTITVQSTALKTSHLTHQRQIEAVEHLWQVLRKMSSEFGAVILIDSILTSEELDAYFRERQPRQIADYIREYSDMTLAARKFKNSGAENADNERPFITDRLWSIFYVLRALYGRAAVLLGKSYEEGKFVNWRTDGGCDQILRAILQIPAVETAKGLEFGGLQAAINFLENEFLTEAGMNKRR